MKTCCSAVNAQLQKKISVGLAKAIDHIDFFSRVAAKAIFGLNEKVSKCR